MIKSAILVVSFSILFISAKAGLVAEEDNRVEDKLDFESLSKPEEGLFGVTPYKSIFLGKNSKAKCWWCWYPCQLGLCCDDGWPKCCVINGHCKCCRST